MSDASKGLLRDNIADTLRARIVSGALPAGTRIREERIAEDHGVSRIPVREALQRLEQEGYLVLTPRRGATVASRSPVRALELMAIRRELESFAARLAAKNRGGEVARDLRELVDKGSAAVARRRHAELPSLIDRFHELVAMASGNGELIDLLAQFRSRVRWMFEVDVEQRQPGAWVEHAEILDAILDGDADRASALMDAHVYKDEQDFRRKATRQTG
jgi:DNA-binding GntR family transcriptional regulator